MASNYQAQVTQSTNKLRGMADTIPNYNVWTKLAKAALNGYGSYLDSKTRKAQLKFNSQTSFLQATAALANADFAKEQAQLNAQATYDQMYSMYRQQEHQAMLQGVQDAQVIHTEEAVAAGKGTRLGVGSKAEIKKSNELAAKINQNAIWENAVNLAGQFKMGATNQQVQGILESANYRAQAFVLMGDGMASQIMSDVIDPLGDALISAGTSLLSSYGGNGGGGFKQMGSDFSSLFSFGGK